MAAFDARFVASPELALVDATLAAELRRTLRLPSAMLARPQRPTYEAAPPAESESVDDLIVEAGQVVERPVLGDTEPSVVAAPQAISADELVVSPDDEPPVVDLPPVTVEIDEAALSPAGDDAGAADASSRAEEGVDASSHYPLLPALDSRATEGTEAALRRIREQLKSVDPLA